MAESWLDWYKRQMTPTGAGVPYFSDIPVDRDALEAKRQSLGAMQASPAYKGLAPGQAPDNLINSVRDGHNAYASAIPAKNYDPTQAKIDAALGYPADPGQSPASTGVVSPGVPSASGIGDWLSTLFSGEGPTLSGILRNGFSGIGGGGDASPAASAAPTGSNTLATTNLPGVDYGPATSPETPASPGAGATTTPTIGDQLQQYKDFIDQIYPKADLSETPTQKQAEAYAANEMKRTALLAQLAMSSGILAQAGYGDVAKGFAAAGSVYDKGFQRYQDALTTKGESEMARRDASYKNDLLRSQAAYKLMADQQALNKEEIEKRRKENIDFLKEGAFPKPDQNGLLDPTATQDRVDKWRRAYEYYLQTGQFISPDATDVRDPAS